MIEAMRLKDACFDLDNKKKTGGSEPRDCFMQQQ
jgi:hypothetical protein